MNKEGIVKISSLFFGGNEVRIIIALCTLRAGQKVVSLKSKSKRNEYEQEKEENK